MARQRLLVVVQVGRANVFHHLVFVIPNRNQLRNRSHLAPTNDRCVLKVKGLTRKNQLLWCNVVHTDATRLDDALDLHIVQHGRWWNYGLTRHGVNLSWHLHCIFVRIRHNDLHLCFWLLHQHLQGLVIKARILLNAYFFCLVPHRFHDAALTSESILERGIGSHKAVVVSREHIVGVVGGLLCVLNVLWATGDKLNNALGAEEHAHQRRQHC